MEVELHKYCAGMKSETIGLFILQFVLTRC